MSIVHVLSASVPLRQYDFLQMEIISERAYQFLLKFPLKKKEEMRKDPDSLKTVFLCYILMMYIETLILC